ncbi:maltose O-acetyltransferase [Rhodococcus pyridinivorans]|uniref:acyltransferase n=1 Tax=Rhodococcus pyridinivorans TaxID=103816 RepID=UPI00089D55C5|nr:acyltransferase [Rhodococcus pyridinivorans]SED49875.1 maltose O-acetyltransferase [Rhodococcus pyridinivorans]
MNLASKIREVLWREAGDHHSVLWLFIVNDVLGLFIFPARIRTQLLRLFIPGIDRRAIIRAHVIFKSSNVRIGPGTVVSYRVMFDTREGITIGRRVSIGADARFLTSDHDSSDPKRRSGRGFGSPITIGDGSRIAVGSTVLPGVTIGEGVIVGACSVVRSDCEDHTLYAGVPAEAKKPLPV